ALGSDVKAKLDKNQRAAKKESGRIFRVDFELEMEKKSGNDAMIDGGKIIQGRTLHRIRASLDIPEGQKKCPITFSPITFSGESDQPEILLTSLENNLIRLEVSWKQSHTEFHEAGASSSWSMNLSGTKNAKLGEKIKLQFGDEKN